MVALDAHDAGGGDAQIARGEVADADEIGGDEGVLEGDEDVEGGLGVGEHVGRIEELGEGRELVGDGLLEEVVGHLFLEGGDEIALVVGGERLEEGGDVDDVGVGGDGEGFGDLGCDEDVAVVLLQILFFCLHVVGVLFRVFGAGYGGESSKGGDSWSLLQMRLSSEMSVWRVLTGCPRVAS